ncbi:M protein trans-acting positive regulator [Enterococcus faecium]|nr:M protein trans-acting positive regulator [Enterococcus faecium]
MYKFLLTKLDQDVYELFAYFFENAVEYKKITDISSKLSISRRTIQLVFDRAMNIRVRYPFFKIEIYDGTHIKLEFASDFLLSQLYSVMLEESMPFQILDRLFKEKYVSLENTAQQYYVSNRTLQRKLKEITEILENYQLALNLKRKALFVGEEYRIRHFFHIMYWQIFDGNNVQYFGLTKRSVTDFKERLALYPSFYRRIDQEKFIQLFALSLYRLKRGFSIDKIPSEMKEMIHLTISFEQFKEELVVPLVKDNYMLKEVTENEYIFLYYMFSVMTTYLSEEIPDERIAMSQFSEQSLEAANLFSETAQQVFLIPESAKKYLFVNGLIIHSTSFLFASKNKIDAFGKTTTVKDYQRVFPKIFPLVQEMYQSLSKQSPIFNMMYASNNRILFQYSMLISTVTKINQSTVRIFHESKFGKIQEIRQKERLKRWFGCTLSFVSENPDFVVTDYPVDRQLFIDQNHKVQFFKWNSFPTGDRWLELIEAIEKFQNESSQSEDITQLLFL